MNSTQIKLGTILDDYAAQISPDVRAKILYNLRSPATFLARVAYWMKKGQIKPTTNCLPAASAE